MGLKLRFGVVAALAGWSFSAVGQVHHKRIETPTFDVIDLGDLDPSGLNDRDQIVGTDSNEAILITKGKRLVLPKRAPSGQEESVRGQAGAINNLGDVVGSVGSMSPVGMSGLQMCNAVIWKAPSYKYEELAGNATVASGLNNLRQIVGQSDFRGFLSSGVKTSEIGTISKLPEGNGSSAFALNDNGKVVGITTVTSRGKVHMHGFLWRKGAQMVDLGAGVGFTESAAVAINNEGVVVGYVSNQFLPKPAIVYPPSSEAPDRAKGWAVKWTNRKLRRLPVLKGTSASSALGINSAGWVVGYCNDKATLWIGEQVVDLNQRIGKDPHVSLYSGVAINRFGHILAVSNEAGPNSPHAYLLVPRSKH